MDPADGQPAQVGGGVEVGHDGLQRVPRGRSGGRGCGRGWPGTAARGRCPPRPARWPAQPARALAKRMGKSIWCSSASRSRKSSSTSWTTSSMRASGRSTLLTTSTTGSRASRALRSTKRVWGRGPSEASTSRRTPSTMVRPRSTSPPKSAWPGVSMMLILTPLWSTAVFLARMVMPFSRSRSPESMTRSLTDSLARKAPDCQSMASTRVVLPWSTWATMATLRMSSRVWSGMKGEGYLPGGGHRTAARGPGHLTGRVGGGHDLGRTGRPPARP